MGTSILKYIPRTITTSMCVATILSLIHESCLLNSWNLLFKLCSPKSTKPMISPVLLLKTTSSLILISSKATVTHLRKNHMGEMYENMKDITG